MPLTSPHDLFVRAFTEHWALGAFNTSNLEVTQAISHGLQAARSPGIIQTSEAAIRYAGLETLRDIIVDVAASVDVPIVLHLDHGKTVDAVWQCIEAGYMSVMFDGSALPLSENVSLTKRVVEFAHAKGVWVEGEVGAMLGKEGLLGGRVAVDEATLTRPSDAEEFVRQTGVDALAIAVGTLHGAFRGREGIRFERLAAIREAISIPLVLHGGSGLPDGEIRRSLTFGVAKVNIDTELREAFHDTLLEHREGGEGHSIDPRSLLTPAREAVQKIVEEKAVLLGSASKAGER